MQIICQPRDVRKTIIALRKELPESERAKRNICIGHLGASVPLVLAGLIGRCVPTLVGDVKIAKIIVIGWLACCLRQSVLAHYAGAPENRYCASVHRGKGWGRTCYVIPVDFGLRL